MAILEELKEGILTNSPEETEALGCALASSLSKNVAIALSGDLGTGKTTFVRGLARGLGIQSAVTSPTYTVYTTYTGDRQLLHMDAYRLSDAHDLDSLTIDEFLEPPFVIAVEWPENIPGFFEDYPTFRIKMEILPDHRHRVTLV